MYREKKRYPKGDINFEISFRIAGILMNENIVKKIIIYILKIINA